MLGKNFSRRHCEIFFLYNCQKTGFGISCLEDNLHKISIPIFLENKKNVTILSSAEFAHSVLNVKAHSLHPIIIKPYLFFYLPGLYGFGILFTAYQYRFIRFYYILRIKGRKWKIHAHILSQIRPLSPDNKLSSKT